MLESHRSLNSDEHREDCWSYRSMRRELRSDQYTMDGIEILGVVAPEGKSSAKTEEHQGDAGARSQGAMAGAISAGVVVPASPCFLILMVGIWIDVSRNKQDPRLVLKLVLYSMIVNK